MDFDRTGLEEFLKRLEKPRVVLIADDEATFRASIAWLLKDAGCKTLEAADGAECLNLFKENKEIDLIILDYKMPKMDGLETFKKIRVENENVPVLFFTAYADRYLRDEVAKIATIGNKAFVADKPLTAEDVDTLMQIVSGMKAYGKR